MPTKEEKEQWIAAQLRQPHGEDGIQVGNMMNKGNRLLYERVFSFLKPNANSHLVEIGMGNGAFVKEVLGFNKNLRYTGCDFSEAMVAESKKNNEGVSAAAFTLTSADSLPFEDNSVDHLFTVNTIYFWEDRVAIINEINRVLKPGAQLIIGMRPKRSMGKFGFTRYGFNMLEHAEVEGILKTGNFNVKDILDEPEPDAEFEEEVLKIDSLVFNAIKK